MNIEYGSFKAELKNRFLCTVEVNGKDTLCYIPSSCRLSNFFNMKARKVILKPIKKKEARTEYSVYAIKYRKTFVLVNLAEANNVIFENLTSRRFSFLGSREKALREHNIEGYKCDLYLEASDTIIEIKSILAFGKEAFFPNMFSERANRQLEAIKLLLAKGHKVCYIFVSLYSSVKTLYLDKKQESFCKLFKECVDEGMQVYAVSLEMKEGEPVIKSKVDVTNIFSYC